ncbi:hypothetical protein [Kitasatospora nipponensis]
MFELLPGTGLRLPGRAGLLRLGGCERAAQWAVATLADVRVAPWTCGARWAFSAQYAGLELFALGDTLDRYDRARDLRGLAAVELRRSEQAPCTAAAVPVVLAGVDLFGYPAEEVLTAVDPDGYPGVRLRPADAGGYLPAVELRQPYPDSAARP